MVQLSEVVRFGMSPTMLFPEGFDDDIALFDAYSQCAPLFEFEAMESFLPFDDALRGRIIKMLRGTHKVLNYNTPGYFQVDGPFNTCSDDLKVREGAYEAMRRHLFNAAEAESPIFVVTGCHDAGEEKRPELMKRYGEFFLRLCEEAKQFPIRVLLEPIERHRFKELILGPTAECAAFIRDMRAKGADNSGLMMDIAHLPLMEETVEQGIAGSAEIGFEHVHMGDAVLGEDNVFYGHTHPPLEVRGSLFCQKDFEDQFEQMIRCGFIGRGKERASISLEVKPYPGVNPVTSIRAMYEKCVRAFNAAAERTGL